MERQKNYVGIDVAKAGMDIAVRPTDERWSISNDEAGIRQLVSRLKTLEPDIVVLGNCPLWRPWRSRSCR